VPQVRVLITDVSGLVGRSVARQLVAAGHTVSGIAHRPHDCLDPAVDFVRAPLHDPVLQKLADDADAVLHLAPLESNAPGAAGINGVARISHAAARAGDRLVFVSQAAGRPALYKQAEGLVSTCWAPSLIVRTAPLVGRQLDWAVSRTVATMLHAKASSQPVRLLHVDDLVRFLVVVVAGNRTGVVELATPDAIDPVTARRILDSAARPRRYRVPTWTQLTPAFQDIVSQQDWGFEFGWSTAEAVADTARGLVGRRLDISGGIALPGHLPLPVEPASRRGPTDHPRLPSAAPEGLEGEFDDRIDPRFPIFSATGLTEVLPGPMTPMTLDVQIPGLRAASRAMAQVMTPGSPVAAEWVNRAIAVFGHHPYVAVSTGVLAAGLLPGWDSRMFAERALAGKAPLSRFFPAGRLPSSGGMLGSAAKAVATGRALALLRHLKTDTLTYQAAATLEHVDTETLTALSDAQLEARIQLLRARIQQGWSLTGLWVIDSGVTAATVSRTGAKTSVSGIDALTESQSVTDKVASLAAPLRSDPRLRPLAKAGDLDGIRALSRTVAAAFSAAVTRMPHRGPGEAELANPTFGDDPAVLLSAAAEAAGQDLSGAADLPAVKLAERIAANARGSRELAYDTTMRFTHELRLALRELGARRVAAEHIDSAGDVYFLTCDELLTMPSDARLRIKRRRAERERFQALSLPAVIDRSWTPLDGPM
jgi:nucleoside-diphosphate-sugar epimerase